MSQNHFKIDGIFMNVICAICLFMFAYLPTSHGTNIYSHTVLVWAVATIIVVIVGLYNSIFFEQLKFNVISILLYMILVTLLAQLRYDQSRVSLYRIAPIVAITFLTHIKIVKNPTKKFMRALLNFFSISCIIWNFGILFHFQPIIDFTYNNYNQYFPLAVFYSVHEQFKPVMTFGVHTYAAFYYLIFFILSYYTFECENKKIYLIYSICYAIFCLFLVSTTGIIYFLCMITFLIYKEGKKLTVQGWIFIFLVLIVFGYLISENYEYLYTKLFHNMTNGENSFVSRYSDQSVFNENFKIITSSLGIGFNILDGVDLGYSDSGIVVYLTMGSIPLCIYIYRRIFSFIKNNILKYYAIPLWIAIISFEIALPATFVYRFIFMIIFVICYFRTLNKEDNHYEEY